MADCYQQGCILSEGHECLHMSAEDATAGELRHQLAERDKRIEELEADCRSAEERASHYRKHTEMAIDNYGSALKAAERAEARVKELETANETLLGLIEGFCRTDRMKVPVGQKVDADGICMDLASVGSIMHSADTAARALAAAVEKAREGR